MTTMTAAEIEAAAREIARETERVESNRARRAPYVKTRQRDRWQALADRAQVGWTTH